MATSKLFMIIIYSIPSILMFLLKVTISQFAISQFTILSLKLWLNELTSKQECQECVYSPKILVENFL